MKLKTYQIELVVASLILFITAVLSGNNLGTWIGSFAVLISFCHTQVADRMAEEQEVSKQPSVDCFKKLNQYLVAKEILWIVYFLILKAYPSIMGTALFLLYPVWRKFYRNKFPKIK